MVVSKENPLIKIENTSLQQIQFVKEKSRETQSINPTYHPNLPNQPATIIVQLATKTNHMYAHLLAVFTPC